MALFDKLKDSTISLKGQPGPNFENEGQRTSSNIQALAKNNILISSQDIISGRTYGQSPNRTKIAPSALDINGKTPLQYINSLGSNNAGVNSQFNSSTGTGFTLLKRLEFSKLGNAGKPFPNFENIDQKTTSDIQALASNNALKASQDMLTGRKYGTGRFTVFVPASQLDGSGVPIGNVYKDKGPKDGRY
jgi:hypothetical protein